jgi:hypothetical protein
MESVASLFADLASGSPILLKAAAAVTGFAVALGVVATAGLLLGPVLAAISLKMVLLTGGLILLVPAIAALIGWLKKSGRLARLGKWFENAHRRLVTFMGSLTGLQALIKGGTQGLYDFLGYISDVLIPMVGMAFDGLAYGVGSIIKIAHDLLAILADIVTLNFSAAWDKMKESFKSAYEEIRGMVRGIIDDFKELFGLLDESERKARQRQEGPAGWAASEEKLTKWREGIKGISEQKEFVVAMGAPGATEAALQRMIKEREAQKVGISGNIKVEATKGTDLQEAIIYVDKNGQNLAGS